MKKKQLVGILNCSKESYFEGGRIVRPQDAIAYALDLFEKGADIVDIGAEATNPVIFSPISEEEEIARILPIISGVRKHTDKPLSIDTYKPKVAEKALEAGVNILNDITGFRNADYRRLAADFQAIVIVMHMPSLPFETPSTHYPEGIVNAVSTFFQKQVDLLLDAGVQPNKIILDPGIGGGSFGKTPTQSLTILKHLKTFCDLGFPLLVSLSRKSFMQKILQKPASELLSTTIALNTMSLLSGTSYIRVHDVEAHRDVLTLLEHLELAE